MPDIRGWNFEAGTSKGSANIFGTSKEWDWNFEVWIWNFERTKFQKSWNFEVSKFQFLISGRWLYPRKNFECSNFLRGTFFWNFECSKFQLFWNFECLKIQWKLSHSKFQNLQNFERKILELRSLNLELRNFEVPTPYARHCCTPTMLLMCHL